MSLAPPISGELFCCSGCRVGRVLGAFSANSDGLRHPAAASLSELICALALVFSLVGCTISAPDTVGSIGDFEITSGMYLLAQYGAYQQAAQLAGTDQDTTDVKAFLKETITTDPDSGETAVLSDYVAQKTQETLETLAAVDARFKALGGELTAEQLSTADRYAQQMMDQYGDTYTANGIGLETLKAFERIQLKHTLLLTLVYGPDGESPVDDSDLTEHLDSQMYELAYVNIPLYNTSTFVFASDDQKAQMLQLAQAAAASCSETQDGSVSEQVSALHSAASAALPDIYAVLDSTPAEDASSVQTELLTESDLTGAFTQDGAADAVRGLVYGEAAAAQYNAASIILMMRIDPLQVSTLDALRTQILSDMKGDELEDALTAYGSTLENDLSTSAMNKMPASKIVNPSSPSNS